MKNIILFGTLAVAALNIPTLGAQELEFPHSWVLPGDSLIINIPDFADIYPRSLRLTEEDYQRVAEEMGIDVATMKAVVEIEAGSSHKGFVEKGIPIVNFDASIFRSRMRKAGKSYAKYSKSIAFQRPNTRKYGSFGAAQWARLESARQIDWQIAEESTFWGMFQIGGFNYQRCGCKTLEEFVERMCRSEAEQLELFAQFCINGDLIKYLREKNWAQFAYHYNGPGYRRQNYHVRLKNAYRKHAR